MKSKMNAKFKFELLRVLVSFALAISIAVVIILFVSEEPGIAIQKILLGPLQNTRYFGNVIELMIPLLFTGLAVSLIFRVKVFNLAVEGMFYAGGLAAAVVGCLVTLPMGLHWVVALVVAGIAGAIVAFIPGVLKSKFHANEVVSSLMLNYVIFNFGDYILKTFIRDSKSTFVTSYKYKDTAKLPKLFGDIHIGFVIIIVLLIVAYVVIYKTRWGYELRITEENQLFSKYSGVKVSSVLILVQLFGGVIAGIGGGAHILGATQRFSFAWRSGFGWDGIIVAIIARYNPKLIPLGAFILSYLRIGSDIMRRGTDVQNEVVAIIQGIIIILLVSDGFLQGYRKKLTVKEVMENQKKENSEEVAM